jgi:ribosome assembly protein 3
MNKSRLAMLVDSLASGADVFTSNSLAETRGVNEMDVVMGNPSH